MFVGVVGPARETETGDVVKGPATTDDPATTEDAPNLALAVETEAEGKCVITLQQYFAADMAMLLA